MNHAEVAVVRKKDRASVRRPSGRVPTHTLRLGQLPGSSAPGRNDIEGLVPTGSGQECDPAAVGGPCWPPRVLSRRRWKGRAGTASDTEEMKKSSVRIH